MPSGIAITNTGSTPEDPAAMARKCKEAGQARRLRAMARVMEGEHSRGEIAREAGVGRQTLCDWAGRYNAEGAGGLRDRPRSGRPPLLGKAERAEVKVWLEEGPEPGTPSWTLKSLKARIEARFGVELSLEGVRLLVRSMGFRKLSPRPIHPKADPRRQEEFRSNFKALAAEALPDGVDLAGVDLYFQDEARLGQKGMLTRVRARRGSRPRVPRDYRYGYCCLFSAICPQAGRAVGHVCGRANTDEMNRHLQDIGAMVAEGRHALAVLDGAGWHRSKALEIPDNVTLLRLPPCSPELNPAEAVFQFLKAAHFANQVFETADAVREKVGAVWSDFARDAGRIRSLGTRSWAKLTGGTPPEHRSPSVPAGVGLLT